VEHVSPDAVAATQILALVKTPPSNSAGLQGNADPFQDIEGDSRNWSPKDLCGTQHLLAEFHAAEESRIADNLMTAAGHAQYEYRPGWSFSDFRDSEMKIRHPEWNGVTTPTLYPHHLALTEFKWPDDRPRKRFKVELATREDFDRVLKEEGIAIDDFPLDRFLEEASRATSPRSVKAKDYGDASEGPGRVTARSSDYDIEEPESFAPRGGVLRPMDATGGWGKHDPLGFDTVRGSIVTEMRASLKEWAGMTTPPPKTADPSVEALISAYLAKGGKVHSCDDYRTTSIKKVKVKKHHTWSTISLPREIRATKRRCGVRPKTGSKQWSNAA
jgi:hypothetical protein